MNKAERATTVSRGGIIVEFNGLPGCGKSTLEKELLFNIEKDIIYCEASDAGGKNGWSNELVRYSHKNFRLRHISFSWLIASVWYGLLMTIVFVFSRKQSRDRRNRYYKKCLILWLVYRIFEIDGRDNCMLLVDEGIICSLASLIHTSAYSKMIVKEIVASLANYKKILIVNFEVDLYWCSQNIKNRMGTSRFDKMTDVELFEALKIKEQLFVFLQSLVQRIGLDSLFILSGQNVYDNMLKLKENIYERISKEN